MDLKLESIIIEIKAKGLFGKTDVEKYARYKKIAMKDELTYLYITGRESYQKYREGALEVFGKDNAFFFDQDNEWERFINRIVELLK